MQGSAEDPGVIPRVMEVRNKLRPSDRAAELNSCSRCTISSPSSQEKQNSEVDSEGIILVLRSIDGRDL